MRMLGLRRLPERKCERTFLLWSDMAISLTERDIRTIENMARTGMSFDDLRKAFSQFPIEEVEKVYMRIRKETVGNAQAGMKINCS